MFKKLMIVLLTGFIVLFSGCVSSSFSGLQYGIDTANHSVVGEFETRVTNWEFFGYSAGINLFNITSWKSDQIAKMVIGNEITAASGDAAKDIMITNKAQFWHLLLNGLTFGLIAPSALEISGTVISQ